jgi:hypothetical protein
MIPIQLEFNIQDESEDAAKMRFLQKQIDTLNESMGNLRRKLFAQVGQLEKICQVLKLENQELKKTMQCKCNEQIEWEYGQGEHLFLMKQY